MMSSKPYQSRYRSNVTSPPTNQNASHAPVLASSTPTNSSTGPLQSTQDIKPSDIPKVNGKTAGVPFEDIRRVMDKKGESAQGAKNDKASDTNSIDYQAILEKARVWPTEFIDKPVGCWAIGGEDNAKVVGTLGNITTITGKAKTKKTFVVTIAVAAVVAAGPIINQIKGLLDPDSTVVLFDTEQSRYHVLRIVKRICRLVGIEDPSNLIVYSLRPYSPDERLKVIDWALNNTPGIKLAIIDGARDLAVDPITDPEDASTIMTSFLKWSDQLNIHIITVLHQNKADNNVRGHLGTELVNKSETVISVSRDSEDKEVSVVAAEYCRDVEFDEFRFSVDETGLPFLVDGSGGTSERFILSKNKAKPTVDTMTLENIEIIIKRALGNDEHLGYGQLRANIIEASEFIGVSLSKSRAESFIQRIVLQGQIDKFRPAKGRHDAYRLPNSTTLIHAS